MIATRTARESFLDAIVPLAPKHCQNLLFIPLILKNDADEHPGRYVPIAEALTAGHVTVTETGAVPALHVKNTGDRPVFAPAGTYLRGGGQDRTLLASVVIDARVEGEIPVHCVERRRWNAPRGTHFHSPEVGGMVASSISTGSSRVDQGATWSTVHDVASDTRTEAPTERHGDAYEQAADALDPFRHALTLDGIEGRVVGAVFFVRYPTEGAHWALDIFGRPDLFRTYFPALRDSAALTALAARRGSAQEDFGLHAMKSDASEFLLRALRETPLATEHLPVNRGALKTGQTNAGARVAILEDLGQPLHTLFRWTAK